MPRVSFFPQRIALKAEHEQLLRQMFPKLPWSYLRFYDAMPWFMSKSFAIATVLPSTYSGGYLNIYLRNYGREEEFQSLSTLVHELFHVLQYYDLGSMGRAGSYFGFFRPFLWHYLSWYFALLLAYRRPNKASPSAAQQAYRFHPMEMPAYDFEYSFARAYSAKGRLGTEQFLAKHPELLRTTSAYPQNNYAPSWAWYLALLLSLLIALSKPLLDLLIGLPYLFLRFLWRCIRPS